MKRMCLILVLCLQAVAVTASVCLARDFMVAFIEEHYKETRVPYSHEPKIYHALQVRSKAGPKLLVLSGTDADYRKWLRQYIAQDKSFMVQVPDADDDAFVGSSVYTIDVTRVHPFDSTKWSPESDGLNGDPAGKSESTQMLFDDRNIMIVDKNVNRSTLISSVVKTMGYGAVVSRDGEQALKVFSIQPEKFKMVIINYDIAGIVAEDFIGQLLKIDRRIPILVETGYNRDNIREQFLTRFSGAGTVRVTPVALDNLQQTITQLVKPDQAEG